MYQKFRRSLSMVREKLSVSISSQQFVQMNNKNYEEAVNCINNLQSNQSYIRNATRQGVLPHSAIYSTTIAETQKFLLRSGITLEQLDELSVIHVAGTKGKGSTCAFCESILRQHGYKTGFYSSPHLVAIRERIKINGLSLSKEQFAENVFRIYNRLWDKRDHPTDMPAYFRFLTILAFNIFIEEKVDVAVIEVGIGGEYDCTNIVRNTPIVGITSLGFDHISMLGNTIEQIAWQKAGIMKINSKAFTQQQTKAAMDVLKQRSIERRCSLKIIPDYNDYKWQKSPPILGINGDVQKRNASLAIQLAHNWMKYYGKNNSILNELIMPEKTKIGLATCKWPGRNQILKTSNAIYYLDGAHTTDSLEICVEWFQSVARLNSYKVLIFNATGDRNSEELLRKLLPVKFNLVIFTPNIASVTNAPDQTNLIVTDDKQLQRCQIHKDTWIQLQNSNQAALVLPCVSEALQHLQRHKEVDVLITGSLHLIGAALSLLDPDLKSFS